MRIAQVLTASTGGIGRHVASLVPRLRAAGHEVTAYGPPPGAALTAAGVAVTPARRLAVDPAPDVVHAHGYKAGALAAVAGLVRPAPLVVTWHNAVLADGAAGLAGRRLQRAVARAADLTLGASSDLVALAEALGATEARLGAVAAPQLPAPARERAAVRASLEVSAQATLVLTVGRLAPQKNLGLLLDVAAAVCADAPETVFALAGEGPERPALAARIAAERLPVRLLGAREDVADLLAAADIALLTSAWEARALFAQEALLAGVPLVATRVGGLAELVGDAAVLVPPADGVALAAQVARLASDPAARGALRTAGLARARAWPDEDAVAADVLTAYGKVRGWGLPAGRLRVRRLRAIRLEVRGTSRS